MEFVARAGPAVRADQEEIRRTGWRLGRPVSADRDSDPVYLAVEVSVERVPASRGDEDDDGQQGGCGEQKLLRQRAMPAVDVAETGTAGQRGP
nr:hypothetical protein [Micromonospora sp. DSM 115978]